MNKNDFLTCLAGRLPYEKDEIKFLLDIITTVMSEGLENDGQVRTPFGVFTVKTRAARRIRRINDGELTTLPEREVVTFKPSTKLKGE
jgi:nucleoid DNA-binding protein